MNRQQVVMMRELVVAAVEACGHTLVGMSTERGDIVLELRRNVDGHEFEAVLSRRGKFGSGLPILN